MAGLTERRGPHAGDSFWTWREVMYRFLDLLGPDDVEAVAAFAFMEMQEAGFGAVAEFHYLHHQPGGVPYGDVAELAARIGAAADTTGIGLTLLPVLYSHGGVEGQPLRGGQLRFGNDLVGFEKLMEGVARHAGALPADARTGIAPHSLRAVDVGAIREALAIEPDAPFHMHIAEQETEVEQVRAVHGARPVEWLLDNVDVDGRWCLIHATHLTSDETERLARSGAVAGLCPVTEANLGDGTFNGTGYARAGGAFGIGSDSNIRISVAEELRQLEYSQRLRDRARVVLADPDRSCGRTLFDAAASAGARALGRDSGAVAPGRWADLVAIDPHAFGSFPDGDRSLDGWVFAGGNDAVTDVWSAGRHRVREGRHVARDAITARYSATLRRLVARL
jgi:formimidoylglutamate deiminase